MNLPNVIIPDEYGGLAICDLAMLIDGLLENDGDLGAAIDNAAFDMVDRTQFTGNPAVLIGYIERLRRLNADDDTAAYWGAKP